jgi:SAM-dependent methyltransferase
MYTPIPEENVYGHRKKLEYIQNGIRNFAAEKAVTDLRVLDFGCGNGTAVSFPIAELGVKLTGLDIHEPSINYARAHAPANAEFVLGSVEQLRDVFDIIVCADVIEHLSQPYDVMTQLRKVLRKGGILIGAVPNGYGPFEIENKVPAYVNSAQLAGHIVDVFFKCRKKLFRISPPPDPGLKYVDVPYNANCGHVQFFRLKDLRRLAAETGYRITEIRGGCVLGSPAFSAHFLQYSSRLIRWNTILADHLPLQLVSTWYFTWTGK